MKINTNEFGVSMNNFEMGLTRGIEIIVNEDEYFCDIDKNSSAAFITLYKAGESKHSNSAMSVFVKPNAYLMKDFFENFAEIARAQFWVNKYKADLK